MVGIAVYFVDHNSDDKSFQGPPTYELNNQHSYKDFYTRNTVGKFKHKTDNFSE